MNMKRILLFLLTNLCVLVLLGLVAQLTGADRILAAQGTSTTQLLIAAAVIGFAGSFISLAMSKWSARMMMGVRLITEPQSTQEAWLVATVGRLAQEAGVGMPQVGIFESPELNAFATGARRNHALVAVSSGLLDNMPEHDAVAVLGHELTHVANGDMVTLALIQGVVNTFVIFLARLIGSFVDSMLQSADERRRGATGPGYFLIVLVLQVVLGLLANLVVLWFSRQREFRADAGGARLAGRSQMIAALRFLQRYASSALPGKMAAFGISGAPSRFSRLFMTHPPLEERIAALEGAEP